MVELVGEALTDYFVDEYGKMSDELGTGSEKKLIQQVSKKFHGHHSLNGQIDEIIENNHYESKSIPELDRIGKPAFWDNHLQGDVPSADG